MRRKKTKSKTTSGIIGSNAQEFQESLQMNLDSKQEVVDDIYEVWKDKDLTIIWWEEMRFLETSTARMTQDDVYIINKKIDLGGGSGTKKKSNMIGMSGSNVDFGFPSLSQVAGTTRDQDWGLSEGNTITICSTGHVAEVNVVSCDTPNATSVLGNGSNSIEVGHESAIKETPTSYATKLSSMSLTKTNLRKLDANVLNYVDYDVWLPLASVHKFSSTEVVDSVLRDGSWMIRGVPIFLNNWSPSISLLKKELSRVPIWVKLHDFPLVAYISDGLSLIALKIDIPMMLDSYTKSMCLESWGGSSYARTLIEIDVFDDRPKAPKRGVNMVEKGKDESSEANHEGFIEVKKKKSGANGGTKNFKPVSMKPKPQYRPKVNQAIVDASPKKGSFAGNGIFSLSNSFEALNVDDPVTVEVESGNKASTSDVQEEGNSSTPLVEKIHRFEQQLLDGKCVLVDEDGKSVEKVDCSGDQCSEDEVEPDDNKIARTYGDADQEYDYDPYDDDKYEGQDIPDNIHNICNNLDIKVATISANGEREIGELIARAIEKVRKDGVINSMQQELEHPLIFIHDKKISDMNSLVRILELAVEKRRPLLIVVEDLEMCFEDGSTADHTVRDVVIKLIFDGLENRLLSVIESLLFVAYPEMISLLWLEDNNLKLILNILGEIYRGEFWDPNSFADGPVRCLLYNLEGEFPFRTVELIRLLSALSEGAWPAECVRVLKLLCIKVEEGVHKLPRYVLMLLGLIKRIA
ncbi:RNA-directed DNA polymerase, eukaryota [Tanacetum coccineum]